MLNIIAIQHNQKIKQIVDNKCGCFCIIVFGRTNRTKKHQISLIKNKKNKCQTNFFMYDIEMIKKISTKDLKFITKKGKEK